MYKFVSNSGVDSRGAREGLELPKSYKEDTIRAFHVLGRQEDQLLPTASFPHA